jgi:uncharacterized membrane protein
MEQLILTAASVVALALEALAIVIIAAGSAISVVALGKGLLSGPGMAWKRRLWLDYAGWIVLALEFTLAADLVRTAVAPTWDDIGKLAAIAAVRTALNYFLWRDLEEIEAPAPATAAPPAPQAPQAPQSA